MYKPAITAALLTAALTGCGLVGDSATCSNGESDGYALGYSDGVNDCPADSEPARADMLEYDEPLTYKDCYITGYEDGYADGQSGDAFVSNNCD